MPGFDIPPWPEDLRRAEAQARGERYARRALENELAALRATPRNRNDALNNAALKLGQLVGAGYLDAGEVRRALFDAAVANGYVAKDGEDAARATIESGLAAGMAEPRHPPERERAGGGGDWYNFNSAGRQGGEPGPDGPQPGGGKPAGDDTEPPTGGEAGETGAWGFTLDKRGRPIWNLHNACLTLETHPDWAGMLAHDEFAVRNMLRRPVPGSKSPKAAFRPRELRDDDLTAAHRWFCRNGFPHATRDTTVQAVLHVAGQTVVNPVRDYLESLAWDGRERLGGWLVDYCHAADSPYAREVGRRWLVSAVARALDPGCKADGMLILEGPQGHRKSTALRTLAGEDWFGDALPDMQSKDAASYLRGRWIVEIAEMVAATRSEIEAVKAFVSRQAEVYRPAYGRNEVHEPRRCIFAGTTNRTDYLRDETGNRRFWPVRVERIDTARLARDRDQLWAEAVAAYKAREPWWLDPETEQAAMAEQADRAEDDPWLSLVAQYVDGLSEVACREVLRHIGLEDGQMKKADSNRVSGLLQRLGWQREGQFTAGPHRGAARFRPPGGRG